MLAILKKELKSYFLSPIGYIVIGIFLLTFSVFFYLTSINNLSIDLGGLYWYTALYGLIIIVPILTMRMFAEERKTGTEQIILTSPVSMIGVVMGKFLAAISVIIITLLVSFMYFIIVSTFGSPNIVVVLVQMLGFLLVSSSAIAIGMFLSSLTENQIIAGILTVAYLIIPLFVRDFSDILSNLTIMNFYQKFCMGVISPDEIIGLVSFTAMFIAFTALIMQRRKLVK